MSVHKPNYFLLPAALAQKMPKMEENELKVVIATAHKTFGWWESKTDNTITVESLVKYTGLTVTEVNKGLALAIENHHIKKIPKGISHCYIISIGEPEEEEEEVIKEIESEKKRKEREKEEEDRKRRRKAGTMQPGEYKADDWQYKYAKRWFDINDGTEYTAIQEDPEPHLQSWANVFRLLIKEDKHEREDIDLVLHWLYKVDDFWINNRAIKTPMKFREKKKIDGVKVTYFQMMLNRAKEAKSVLTPEKGKEYTQYQVDEFIRENPEVESRFMVIRYDDRNNKVYEYE